ncbi:YkyA family protein [Paenalkalicoccus suaedae]|uniref:YkyA family protein n=1 Tax=Paenalkalicoccus suaedae TaxID=2592382 RepID=A0A859FFI1_9BACI|nr:YkyA family protein [Paenalkalicoccus suaedae]QKS71578.1 YkyA family protein [Paenalkalicoccus suaedae]
MKIWKGVAIALVASVLAGCSNDTTVEDMYTEIEAAFAIEREIEELQAPLMEAEQNETTLYNDMLTISEVEEIEPLATEAITSAEERRGMMEDEKEVIDNAYEQFQTASPLVEDLDEELQPDAEAMFGTMEERYGVYEELHQSYLTSIEADILLYEMVQNEEVEMEELREQHETVNAANAEVSQLSEQFNELTTQFNDEKLAFYEAAGLNVVE